MLMKPEDILAFWSYELGPARWFAPDPALDTRMRAQFLETYDEAVAGRLDAWQETPEGMLTLLLLLDQFPRRMFRDTAQAYAMDEIAVDLARTGIIKHFDDHIDRSYKLIFYLPFQHSESLGNQRLSVFYIHGRTKEDSWLDAAEACFAVIQHFGRFPQRNAILQRETTPEEAAYLATPQSKLLSH